MEHSLCEIEGLLYLTTPVSLRKVGYDRVAQRGRTRLPADVRSTYPSVQDRRHRRFHRLRCLRQAKGVAQQHGHAENRGTGVRDVAPGNVRRGAVDGLVQPAGPLTE